jgi:ribosomal protein S18 acetylase RimI-like enzyme
LKIRDAKTADAARLESLRVRAWRDAYPGLVEQAVLDELDPTDETELAVWRNLIDHEMRILIAESESGETLGFCAIAAPSRDADEPVGVAEIAAIYVDPEHYRGGLGRAMLKEALRRLTEDAWMECTVWTLTKNARALALYESLGFERDGSERTEERWLVPDIRLRLALN